MRLVVFEVFFKIVFLCYIMVFKVFVWRDDDRMSFLFKIIKIWFEGIDLGSLVEENNFFCLKM